MTPSLPRLLLLAAATAVSLLSVGAACTPAETAAPAAQAPAGSGAAASDPRARARQLVAAGAALVDVRTPGEFADGHADGALNIPLDALGGRLDELDALLGGDRTKPLVVYCRTGRRSGIAQRMLTERGYGDVVNGINQATLRGD